MSDAVRFPPIYPVGATSPRRLMVPRPMHAAPPARPAYFSAATHPSQQLRGNGRSLDFSREFMRKTAGEPVVVLHYVDASLDKATLDRELAPAREAKAELKVQRRAETVARAQQRQQREAQRKSRRSVRRRGKEEQARADQRQAAVVVQKVWRKHLAAPSVANDGSRVLSAAEQEAALRDQLYESSLALIQAWACRCIARKRAERARREARDELLDEACVLIQCYARRRRAFLRVRALAAYRRIESDMDALTAAWQPRLREQAATTICAACRGSIARRNVAKQKRLGVMFNDMRATKAALRIQTMYRGKVARDKRRRKRKEKNSRARPQERGARPNLARRGSKAGPPESAAPAASNPPPPAPGTWQATPPPPLPGGGGGASSAANPRKKKLAST